MWTLSCLNLDMSTDANRDFSLKSKTEWSVDPDEMAFYEPSHLDLHCSFRYVLVCQTERKVQ